MKHLILSILLLSCFTSFSQTKWMVINKKSGAPDSVRVSDVQNILFKTHPESNTITDIDGNVYQTVIIGTQEWTVENLKVTHYFNGVAIPEVTSSNWTTLTTGARCAYNNDISNVSLYGYLYNFYAVNTGKLAPQGWRVATESDWLKLITFLGGAAIAGGKLKESGTLHWSGTNLGATNSSGFTALPGGQRGQGSSNFVGIEYSGSFWTITPSGSSGGIRFSLGYNYEYISGVGQSRDAGYSVRCVRDL